MKEEKEKKKDESKTPVENTIKRQEKSLSLFSMRFIAKSIDISGFFLRLYSSRRRELLGQWVSFSLSMLL